MKKILIKTFFVSLVFFGTGYFVIIVMATLSQVSSGTPLTATIWNDMISNFFWKQNGSSVYYTGNVGIGTTSPSAKLEVDGEVKLKDVGNMGTNSTSLVTKNYVDSVGSIVGEIKMRPKSTAPTGYLICNGAAISRTTYANLFSIIGTTYGAGDGSTTFNLPDFQGRSPKGVGTSNGGTDVPHVAETVVLGTKYNDKIQGHSHRIYIGISQPVPNQGLWAFNWASATRGGLNNWALHGGGAQSFIKNVAIEGDGTNGEPRVGTTTTGKVLGVNFIIKY